MNGGFWPAVVNPISTSKKQMASDVMMEPVYMGGSQRPSALGRKTYVPRIIKTKTKKSK